MRVLRAFDFYRVGDVMTPDAVADQQRRGNIPDLIRNGFIEEIAPPVVDYSSMSYRELQVAAKAAGITARQTKAELIKALQNGN